MLWECLKSTYEIFEIICSDFQKRHLKWPNAKMIMRELVWLWRTYVPHCSTFDRSSKEVPNLCLRWSSHWKTGRHYYSELWHICEPSVPFHFWNPLFRTSIGHDTIFQLLTCFLFHPYVSLNQIRHSASFPEAILWNLSINVVNMNNKYHGWCFCHDLCIRTQ